MSKSEKKASEKGQDEHQNDSVYDFLYCDTPRIGSFLAQFDDAGHLQTLTQREGVTLGVKRGFKLALGGGATIVGTGGSGNLALERGPSQEGSESVDRVYDPLWTNARTFLDFIYEKEMIHKISEASLGSFVLVSGDLTIIDMSLYKHILANPVLKKRLVEEDELIPTPSRAQRRARNSEPAMTPKALGMELMPIFPLTAQATINSGDELTWATLAPSCMTVQAGDLLLQHGVKIPGSWHMLAILDSKPEAELEEGDPVDSRLLPIASALAGLIPTMRQLLGRPSTSYGVTPLLIFRDVSGQ